MDEDYGNPGNPTVTIQGDNVVGGVATATVSAPDSAIIKEVTWHVTGAVEKQTYSNAEGKIESFPTSKTVTVNDGSASIQFYWDATPGAHTVSAVVTYASPWSGGGSDSDTFTVIAPTVNRFVLDSYPLRWVDNPKPGFLLLSQPGQVPSGSGFSLGASVTLPNTANESGNYGFIQKASLDLTVENEATGNHTLDTGGLVLDNNPAFNGPNAQGWLGYGSWNSNSLNPGDTVENRVWETDSPFDPVTVLAPSANVMGSLDPPIEAELNAQFETWLVYKSGSGIWVGIGQVTLTISGHQRYDAATSTWVEDAAPTPGGLGVIVTAGAIGPRFVTWTGYMRSVDFTPPYSRPYFYPSF